MNCLTFTIIRVLVRTKNVAIHWELIILKEKCFMCCYLELGQSPKVTQLHNAFLFNYN